ncbi:MAG: S9 family peptidase [Bacteroidales bacterium]
MKKIYRALLITAVAAPFMFSCAGYEGDEEQKAFAKKEICLESDLMSPEVLWSFGRISDIQVSPDTKTILFGITYYDIGSNKGNRELYIIQTDGSGFKRLTYTPFSEYNARWKPDGSGIGFLSPESGSVQLWEISPEGKNKKQISRIRDGISGFSYASDLSKILYTKEVLIKKPHEDLYQGLPKASGRIMNDLMYRHWDHWVDSYSHIFIADYNGNSLSGSRDIMKGEPWGSPLSPFGGMEQITWGPGNNLIAYTAKKMQGLEYSRSTNSDIYVYNIAKDTTWNLTEGMMGFDTAPVFSPDGSKLAWESMERDGYESDKNRLFVYDFNKDLYTDHSRDFDQNVHGLSWSGDGKSLHFISEWHGTQEIYSLHTEKGSVTKLTDGIHNYVSVTRAGSKLIAAKQSMSMPTEIFAVDPDNRKSKQLTTINGHILDQLTMGNVEKRWIKTTDNKDMLTWIIYPPHFDPGKKYPTLLYCQGGPQSMVSQFWSYRWNFQMMAANGYIVAAPNRRGLPGFGQEWNEQISGDYGGQNMKDYFSAIDEMSKEPYVDENNLGAVGASYGGFSVFWLAGNHNGRFKAFIAHDGMFNLEAQYLETEELWFVNWDLGGPFWDFDNPTAQKSYANSPHKFVHKWDTPILIIHGEKDYRITYTQGMSAFNAAIIRGIPAEFLYFPDENHWVLTPQNGILWQRTFFHWLDKWLK